MGYPVFHLAILQTHLLGHCFKQFCADFPPLSQMTSCALSTWKIQLNQFFLLLHKILADLYHLKPSRADDSLFRSETAPHT